MGEIIKNYGKIVAVAVLTIAIIVFFVNSGLQLGLADALGITTESNDNQASSSNMAIKAVVERELPEITGNTNIITDKEYQISYDSSHPDAECLFQTEDADGTINTSCNVVINSIENENGDVLYPANNVADPEEITIIGNKITFLTNGVFKMQVEVTDAVGANQTATIAINVNGSEEDIEPVEN